MVYPRGSNIQIFTIQKKVPFTKKIADTESNNFWRTVSSEILNSGDVNFLKTNSSLVKKYESFAYSIGKD